MIWQPLIFFNHLHIRKTHRLGLYVVGIHIVVHVDLLLNHSGPGLVPPCVVVVVDTDAGVGTNGGLVDVSEGSTKNVLIPRFH